MDETHFAISIFVVLLLLASGVGMLAKWVRVPYTLLLVVMGLIVSPMHFLPPVHISPELVLLIFLPALLFEAAWNLEFAKLRASLVPILLLASVGVGLAVGVVGAVLHFGTQLPWSTALLFGAMISATDPVSVLALFKKAGLPGRLTTIVEGESLFNDGTAVVVFRIMLGVVAGAAAASPSGMAWGALSEFAISVLGGVGVGALVGFVASSLTAQFDDHLLEISLTTIAAYGSYLVADTLGTSPVIAVLVVGLILGNYGRRTGMSPTTQIAIKSFWEYAAFVVNSLVFLLIGLEVQLSEFADHAGAILWAVAAMLASRSVAVYGLLPLSNRVSTRVPFRWQHVLAWGGLRGALSMALVLSLPTDLPGRSLLVVMIFGTVVFSLLVQGMTMGPLIRWLGMSQRDVTLVNYETLRGRLMAESAVLAELDAMRSSGRITERLFTTLRSGIAESRQELGRSLEALGVSEEAVEAREEQYVRRHLALVKKSRLAELVREETLSDATFHQLNRECDDELAALESHHSSGPARSE